MEAIQNCIDDGDTSFMLTSMAQVLLMSPALAFFEAGALRTKDTLSVVMQIFVGFSWLSCLWFAVGFSLTFGPDHGGVIGDFQHAFFIGVPVDGCFVHQATIPAMVFGLFENMFAVITPLLITGAIAGRMKFRAYMIFITLWEILIYYPLAHWVWGLGWLEQMGVLDFAGGIVIHVSAGTSAVICALYLGKRRDFDNEEALRPHSIPYTVIGAGLLWFGWFGFNAGSALDSSSVAASTALSTHMAAASAGMTWLVLSWWKHGRPRTLDFINGAIGGLAGVTPASGYIHPGAALGLGVVLGLAAWWGAWFINHKCKVDDALEVSSVHGLTGWVGAISIGFLASSTINPDAVVSEGIFYGGSSRLFGIQILASVVTIAWSGFWTFVFMVLIDRLLGGVRVTAEEEDRGLDWSAHQDVAYSGLEMFVPQGEDAVLITSDRASAHRLLTVNSNHKSYGTAGVDNGKAALESDHAASLLHVAAASEGREILAYLVEKGCDPNQRDKSGLRPLDIALRCGRRANIEYLQRVTAAAPYRVGPGMAPAVLVEMAAHGDLAGLKKAFAAGNVLSAPDREGRTPLSLATVQGRLDMIRFMVEEAGVDPDVGATDTPGGSINNV